MAEGPPRHNLLAELLQAQSVADPHDKPWKTHLCNPRKVTRGIYPQNLGRDLPAIMLALPHVPEFIVVYRVPVWVITKGNRQRSRKQAVVAANPV